MKSVFQSFVLVWVLTVLCSCQPEVGSSKFGSVRVNVRKLVHSSDTSDSTDGGALGGQGTSIGTQNTESAGNTESKRGGGSAVSTDTDTAGAGGVPIITDPHPFSVSSQGDPCVRINRLKGDPARYGFCPNSDNTHITDPDEKATLDILSKIITPKLASMGCTCQNQASLLKRVLKLSLRKAGIKDLSPFGAFPEVKLLDLSDNLIDQDPSYLASMTKLQAIFLRNNKLTSVQSLSRIPSISAIDVSTNLLENVDYLKNLKNLKNLDISNNKVGSIVVFKDSSVNINYTGNTGIITEYAHTILNPGSNACQGTMVGLCDAVNSYNNFVRDAGLQGIAPPLPENADPAISDAGLQVIDTGGAAVFATCSAAVSTGQQVSGEAVSDNACGL